MKKFKLCLTTFLLTISVGAFAQSDLFNLTDTWTDGGTNDFLKAVITDTSSAADSNMLNLQVIGNGAFAIRKDGDFVSTLLNSDSTNRNYAFGATALDLIVVGSGLDNIAIGENAGTAITTGDANVAIGSFSLATLSTGSSNTTIGESAGNDLSSGETGNTFIGRNSGVLMDEGSYNTFVGYNAGSQMNGSGGDGSDYNIFIGNGADGTSTVGSFQISIGGGSSKTLYGRMSTFQDVDITGGLTLKGPSAATSATVNTSAGNLDFKMGDHATAGGSAGLVRILAPDDTVAFSIDEDGNLAGKTFIADVTNRNYAYGSGAGDSITVGSGLDNVLIGENAGTSITDSDKNIIIGTNAFANATGSLSGGNVVIGQQAGQYNSSTSIVAIGWSALDSSSNSDSATVVGALAGKYVGDNVTAIGYKALDGVTNTGASNIGIGYKAGDNAAALGFSIIIGVDADFPSTSDNDQLVIGNAAGNSISGYMGARTDLDYSAKDLTISGPSAYSAAATNQDGGDLVLQAGQKASGGGVSGNTLVNNAVYGGISAQVNSTAETTVDATPRKVLAWNTDGLSHGTTVDHTSDDIICDVAGVFMVSAGVSFSGTNSATYFIEIYVNGAASGFRLERKMGTGGDIGRTAISGLVQCAATDDIALYQYTADGSIMTVTEATLSAVRISN